MRKLTELSVVEQSELSRLESIIEKNLKSFYEVGKALTEIRDQRLYREKYETFQEYCKSQWDISRPRAYQIIKAVEVQNDLSTVVDKLLPERILRPLTSLSPDKRIEIVQKVIKTLLMVKSLGGRSDMRSIKLRKKNGKF